MNKNIYIINRERTEETYRKNRGRTYVKLSPEQWTFLVTLCPPDPYCFSMDNMK